MSKKDDLLDGPPLSIKISKRDHLRFMKHAEKSPLKPSALARLYIMQRIEEEEGKKK